ncbi:hypothetical protein [Cognatilysobacter segetis]|uniref:hypothetical protein n=1 Tax=Cognatilysobacter segetis TaxID=2492394 RepID=UPI00105CD79E|nr:hypothetical protein [Lysobacter segetis]
MTKSTTEPAAAGRAGRSSAAVPIPPRDESGREAVIVEQRALVGHRLGRIVLRALQLAGCQTEPSAAELAVTRAGSAGGELKLVGTAVAVRERAFPVWMDGVDENLASRRKTTSFKSRRRVTRYATLESQWPWLWLWL